MTVRYGYKASAEQFGPRRLLDFSVLAERLGLGSAVESVSVQRDGSLRADSVVFHLASGAVVRRSAPQVTRALGLLSTWFTIGQLQVTWTQVIGLGAGIAIVVVTTVFLRYTKLGTAMRAMANDREITATLGVPVRRVEAAAWLGCGVIAGVAGLLLADLVALDATTLTFLVISSLAAALIARLRSIVGTFVAAMAIGLIHDLLTPIQSLSSYRDMTPFVLAAVALLVFSRHQVISLSREEA